MTSGKTPWLLAVIFFLGGLAAFVMMGYSESSKTVPDAVVTSDVTKPALEGMAVDFLNYDMVVGDKNAPVEIIEYAAISCSHCANFHKDVLPLLKEKYLDTGRARLVYRNFIFDNPYDVFASTLTRCMDEGDFFSLVGHYFRTQNMWINMPELRRIYEKDGKEAAISYAQSQVAISAETAGLTAEAAGKCFDNRQVLDYLLQLRQIAVETYGVDSTPTLIVGGRKLESHDMKTLSAAIEMAEKQLVK